MNSYLGTRAYAEAKGLKDYETDGSFSFVYRLNNGFFASAFAGRIERLKKEQVRMRLLISAIRS